MDNRYVVMQENSLAILSQGNRYVVFSNFDAANIIAKYYGGIAMPFMRAYDLTMMDSQRRQCHEARVQNRTR